MKRGGFLTASDRDELARFPAEIAPDDVVHCFTLRPSDHAEVVERRYGPAGRLAAGLQIGALRLLGFVPTDLGAAPHESVGFVADQVGAVPADLVEYTDRAQTRSDHVAAVERHLGFRKPERGDLKRLGDWLTERALEHDRPTVLFRLACDWLLAEGLVRPGVTTVERSVIAARQRATEETFLRVAPQLDPEMRVQLDGLLDVDDEVGMTRLVWLRRPTAGSVPVVIREHLDRLALLRTLRADQLDLSGVNPNRVRHLAQLGRRMTPQAIARLEEARRYQILAATVADELVRLTDDVLDLFDVALATVDRDARSELERISRSTATVANETVRLFGQIARVLLDPTIADHQVRSVILNQLGEDHFSRAVERAAQIERPVDGSHLDLVLARYSRIRQFAPHVLAAFDFHGNGNHDLFDAITLLRRLNAEGARRVPDDAPVGFVPAKWRRHVRGTDGRIARHGWELSALMELRGALRAADIWVEHSRRYRDPTSYLIPIGDWERLRPESPTATGIPLDPNERLHQLDGVVNGHLSALDAALTDTDSVRIEDDRLVVTPLSAETPDPELEQLRNTVSHVLPEVDLVDLLVEVNSWCGFLDSLVHAGHSTDRSPDHTARLLAAVVANGCNFGLATMARIAGFTADELTWTQDWYLRTETVRAGNDRIVNHQIRQPIAQLWGTGTLSSSDGQRFPMVASSPRARAMRRYFTGSGATIYTWTSDRHAQYGTRIIPTTVREATYVLDAIFDNETDLDIEEHTTDTAGYTDLVFGLFDLTGLTFSPRIRDLADQRLWRLPSTDAEGPAAGLLRHRVSPARFIDRWDDMLRVATTIRHGYLPASLLVSRLQASARQNQLTRAIQEYGRVIKTISILRYLHDEQHRRRIHAQLNKGESLHALRRQLFFANQGQIRRRRSDDQDLQGECLTLLTNAVICWNTIYTQAAIAHLASGGAHVRDEHLARLSPAGHDHINFYGRYDFTNPTRPPHGQLRPLRTI
ncbi:MAG: Tn3 family transposase [Acidimicrobiia bacterium]|nr:Tn3 family transposase [Acidimicrobiia bacterium]